MCCPRCPFWMRSGSGDPADASGGRALLATGSVPAQLAGTVFPFGVGSDPIPHVRPIWIWRGRQEPVHTPGKTAGWGHGFFSRGRFFQQGGCRRKTVMAPGGDGMRRMRPTYPVTGRLPHAGQSCPRDATARRRNAAGMEKRENMGCIRHKGTVAGLSPCCPGTREPFFSGTATRHTGILWRMPSTRHAVETACLKPTHPPVWRSSSTGMGQAVGCSS